MIMDKKHRIKAKALPGPTGWYLCIKTANGWQKITQPGGVYMSYQVFPSEELMLLKSGKYPDWIENKTDKPDDDDEVDE